MSIFNPKMNLSHQNRSHQKEKVLYPWILASQVQEWLRTTIESTTNLAKKICTVGSITANHFMATCAKFVRYIMVVHLVQQIRIVEPGSINQSPSMKMLVKRYGATIPQKVINKPFLVWQSPDQRYHWFMGKREKPRAIWSQQLDWKIDPYYSFSWSK